MSNSLRLVLLGLATASALFAGAAGNANAVIAKARAYLGTEAALNGVRSIHYTGTLVTVNEAAADPKPVEASVEMIFVRTPGQQLKQRISAVSPQGIEVTALDNFDAWHQVQDAKDKNRWSRTQQGKEEIKRLRANTLEYLTFYRAPNVTVEDLGTATIGGVICHKLVFRHDAAIAFTRYFDQVSGRLVLTETGQGGTIKEEGEMVVNGIRFPRKMVTEIKQADGKKASVTVNISKVTLNESFPDDLFAMPGFLAK